MNAYLAFFAACCIPAAAILVYSWEDEKDKDARIKKELYNARPHSRPLPSNTNFNSMPQSNYNSQGGQTSLKDQQLLAFIFSRRHETDITKVLLEHENRPVSEDPGVQAFLREQQEKSIRKD